MSSSDITRFRLFDESIAFRLYADHANGMSVSDLAKCCSRSECWVREQVEAARLCLEKQVRVILPPSEPSVCAAEIWSAQVWN